MADNRHCPVRPDMDKDIGVEAWSLRFDRVRASYGLWPRGLAWFVRRLLSLRGVAIAECETAQREIQSAQERPSRDKEPFGAHRSPPEAFLIASRIRPYVPHRQRLPAMDCSICASEGLGFFLRSAVAVIT